MEAEVELLGMLDIPHRYRQVGRAAQAEQVRPTLAHGPDNR